VDEITIIYDTPRRVASDAFTGDWFPLRATSDVIADVMPPRMHFRRRAVLPKDHILALSSAVNVMNLLVMPFQWFIRTQAGLVSDHFTDHSECPSGAIGPLFVCLHVIS